MPGQKTQSISSSSGVKLPAIIRDVTLLSPGVWNGFDYPADEIRKAFELTDWNDTNVTSLFLDHPENPNNAASAWAGWLRNQHILDDATVKGDLEIWDEDTVIKLTLAKAKFGVSPRLLGSEDVSRRIFEDFIFDNISIVSKPAQSTAIINLSKKLSSGLVVKQLNRDDYSQDDLAKEKAEARIRTIAAAKKVGINVSEMSEENNITQMKGGIKQMSEEVKTEESADTTENKEKPEEKTEEKTKAEAPAEGEEAAVELSDADVIGIMNDNLKEFNEYAGEARKVNPGIGLKELASKFKAQKAKFAFVEELSSDEALALVKKLMTRVDSKVDVSGVKEMGKSSESKELSNKLDSVAKELSELKGNLNKGAPKSVNNQAVKELASMQPTPLTKSAGISEMVSLLKSADRK